MREKMTARDEMVEDKQKYHSHTELENYQDETEEKGFLEHETEGTRATQ